MAEDAEDIRVLVVDDHPVVRQGLRSFLSTRDGIDVVGEAADGEQAVRAVATLRPDVVLMDLVMPQMDGVAATRAIRSVEGAPEVIVLTSFASEDQVIPAVQAGAAGYLLKDAAPGAVEDAIRRVHRGEALLDPQVARLVMAEVAAPRPAAATPPGLDDLTAREREVLAHLAGGLTNRELAAALFLSEKTVKTHVSSILTKLRLPDRTQAALFAVRHGIGPPA
jgi:NarL family two-component system response regulator LiaR